MICKIVRSTPKLYVIRYKLWVMKRRAAARRDRGRGAFAVRRSCTVRYGGALWSANVGMSNEFDRWEPCPPDTQGFPGDINCPGVRRLLRRKSMHSRLIFLPSICDYPFLTLFQAICLLRLCKQMGRKRPEKERETHHTDTFRLRNQIDSSENAEARESVSRLIRWRAMRHLQPNVFDCGRKGVCAMGL